MGEKITASDYLDDSLRKALEALLKDVQGINKEIGSLLVTMKSFDETAKKGATTQEQLGKNVKFVSDTSKKLSDDEKELEKLQQRHYQTLLKITAAKSEENKKLQEATERLKRENLERKAAIDSNEGLRAKIALLRDQKEKLARTDKDYADKIKNLNNEIDKNQKLIDKTNDSEQNRKNGIGKYQEAIVGAYTKIIAGVGAAIAMFKTFEAVLTSTASGANKLEAAMAGLHGAYEATLRTVQNSDWKNFFKNIDQGQKDAIELTRTMQLYNGAMASNQILNAEEKKQLWDLQAIYKNRANSIDDRKNALEQYIKIREDAAKREVNIEKVVNDDLIKEFTKRTGLNAEELKQAAIFQAKNVEAAELLSKISYNTKVLEWDRKKLGDENEKTIKDQEHLNEQYKEASELLAGSGLSIEKALSLNIIKEKLNKSEINELKESYARLGNAISSQSEVYAETARIRGTLTEKENKETEEKNKNIEIQIEKEKKEREILNKKGEEWLKKYLDRENEKRDQTEKFNQYVIDQENKKADEIEKTEQQITDDIIAQKKREAEEFEKNEERKQRAVEETRQLQIEAVNSLFDLNNTFYETDLQNLEAKQEKEINAIEDKEERGVYSSKVAAKKKEQIENEYARKIAKIKRKQAEAERIQSLFNIGVNTAQAIIKFLADPGGYQGVALSAWAAVIGAIQTAAVMAQPIPQFFKGVKNFEGGLAWTGEEGVELGETKEGNMFLTPDQATLMALPRGANIYTHERTIEMMGGMQPQSVDKLIAEQRKATEAFQNQKHYEWTPDSLIEINRKTKSRREHLDKYFRC